MPNKDYPGISEVSSVDTANVVKLKADDSPQRTVNDWFRDLRMSSAVNRATVGVDTDRITPDLLMATSSKLLKINKREADDDAKDSLAYQRVYGPAEYFAEHVLRDADKLGRKLLWKATNRGNIDFMPVAALDQHVDSVFQESKMSNYVEGSTPLESIEASYKVSRIGEGGVADTQSAPDEMRLVQPSFLGYIDPVRSAESARVGLDAYMTKHCMKGTDGKLYQKFVNARTGKEELVDSVTAAKSVITTPDMAKADSNFVYALGGKTGVRIVKKSDIDYYLPRMDEAFTNAANMVTGMSGVKELRLLMGCLHPLSNVLTVSKRNDVEIVQAKTVSTDSFSIPGCSSAGVVACHPIRTTVAKFPQNRAWFRKIVLYSGRSLITSRDHKWAVVRDGKIAHVHAEHLKRGDLIPRTTFKDIPNRRTFLCGAVVTKDIAVLLGYAVRTLACPGDGKLTITYQPRHREHMERALQRLGSGNAKFYSTAHKSCIALFSGDLYDWLGKNVGVQQTDKRIPKEILSAYLDIAVAFLDAYTADETQVGIDACECMWVLNLPNTLVRDGISFLLARTGVDSAYRDSYRGEGDTHMALKLQEMKPVFGDCVLDTVKSVLPVQNAPIMIDIDVNDNLYAVANGIVTHNSKYPQQAVPIEGREPPLVRALDERSGSDLQSKMGAYLGVRYASAPGTVTAVRKDRIDVLYDDGTKGSVPLYQNFPMNAKGYIDNKPVVKAGQSFRKGDVLASSNYTDDKGVAATGTNLRTGWISWKGGTYEDAIVISESASKKLAGSTMSKTTLDLDKTISIGRKNYLLWKPGEFDKDQLSVLDDEGVVLPGMVLRKGDPMVLAVRTNEPSPGTSGKRILTDMSEVWEHDYPGVVTDVVKTRKGVSILAKTTVPARVGDKLSGLHGNKGVISRIYPDDQMPHDKEGKPLEMLMSPLGLISRTNPAQLTEALLGKVAMKTGKPEILPAFLDDNIYKHVLDKLKQSGISPDDDFIDPDTGRTIANVVNGPVYVHRLKHMAEDKMSARGVSGYTADDTPGGRGFDSGKRYGPMEQSMLAAHGAFENLIDAKLIRGQSNADFWRSVRTGEIPVIPGEPLVHKKFFASLQGAGINVRKTPKGISVFALSDSDVKELAGPRELRNRGTYDAKSFTALDGGLFGKDIFGTEGNKWGYIKLDDPLPNPVMSKPLARLLRLSDKEFDAIASGQAADGPINGGRQLKDKLESVNLAAESKQALQEFKDASPSRKDAALKRYVAIERMHRAGIKPSDYMLEHIPVLPPVFRPITAYNGLNMVSDANYLYAQLLDARDDLRAAEGLPDEYAGKAKAMLYRSWNELTGMYDPENVKLKNKNVGGLLQWALGKGSPKYSGFQQKVLGTSVDTVGRGVVVPSSKLELDQVGLPEKMAFGIMAPFVTRALVKRGYTPIDALRMVKRQDSQARDVLLEVMQTHPVHFNRAPTLHKYSILAFKPVLVQGDAIHMHPSVCPGATMDFDGDAVNLHVPVSDKSRKEALERMLPSKNLLAVSDRKIMNKPEKEYMQGLYIATRMGQAPGGRATIFRTLDEARDAYRSGAIDIDTPIQILEKRTAGKK